MPYIRISIVRPRRGDEARLEAIMHEIARTAAGHDGCLQSYVMHPRDDSGEVVRLAIYETEEAAEATASDTHMLALRSQMHLLCEPGYIERAFFTVAEETAPGVLNN